MAANYEMKKKQQKIMIPFGLKNILVMMEHLHFQLNFGTILTLTNEQIMTWKRTITV
jgi:hypothetical protein